MPGRPPEGCLASLLKQTTGIRAFDVWDSEEPFQAFGVTLVPILAGPGGWSWPAASLACPQCDQGLRLAGRRRRHGARQGAGHGYVEVSGRYPNFSDVLARIGADMETFAISVLRSRERQRPACWQGYCRAATCLNLAIETCAAGCKIWLSARSAYLTTRQGWDWQGSQGAAKRAWHGLAVKALPVTARRSPAGCRAADTTLIRRGINDSH